MLLNFSNKLSASLSPTLIPSGMPIFTSSNCMVIKYHVFLQLVSEGLFNFNMSKA